MFHSILRKCINQMPRRCRSISSATAIKDGSGKKTTLGVLGVPFAKGQTKQGVERAPDELRAHGMTQLLEQNSYGNLIIRDYGNLEYLADANASGAQQFGGMKNYCDFMGCNRALIKKVQQILQENDQILTLGGDHAIGFGSVAGHLQHTPQLSLVWIDAHADINLHNTSASGNIHGMPVSLLLQELRIYWENANLDKIAPNCLTAKQLIYIGLRDIDAYEAYLLSKLGIRAFAMDAIDRYGIQKIIEMTLDALNPAHKIHLSFDVDALDRIWAPSTGTIVDGGLTLREGISIVEALRDTKRVQAIDLVEINPQLGSADDVKTTIASSMEILKGVCGHKRGGYYQNLVDTTLFH